MNADIDISEVRLKTPRLWLRPWQASDLADLYAYASVEGVGQLAGWLPHQDIETSRAILEIFITEKKTFAVERQGRVIGSLGIELYREDQAPEFQPLACREIGYVLAKPYWGRGLMPEAVQAALRWLFKEQQLAAVFCGYFTRNHQSARVQEKCGFKPYKQVLHQTQYGTTEVTQLNVLRRADWLAAQACTVAAGPDCRD
ncbi:GNAT family N-acetyltransferase [Oscillospiraceae bacterium HV4-5-C5C]|nr:GNAT family N-acetyltransferase [Oscillospiraceae bacterium HV4-5-C5C]